MPDDATITEGDAGFLGMASRLNPLQLQPGMVQYVENMRLDRGVAQTRKGAKRLGDGISAGTQPLVLPFVMDANAIIRSNYDGGIFASGVFSSPNFENAKEYIVLCGPTSAFLWRQGELIQEIFYPAEELLEPSDSASCVQAFNRFYILREDNASRAGWGLKFTNALGISVSGTTATVNIAGHGYVAGQRVRIENSAVAAFAGHEYDIASVASNNFTIQVPTGTASDVSANIAVRRVKPPLWWDGSMPDFVKADGGVPSAGPSFKTLRSVPFAAYIGNRLWIPDGRDTVAISDVLDPDLYDPFFQTFRANAGSNDYIVGIHPWVEGQALIFMRNSIWIASLKQDFNGSSWDVDSAVSNLNLLTDEIGCVSRKTIVTAGQYVFFLSDAGVYRLDTQLDLKLRANTLPLSDPIADQLEQINTLASANAVGRWWNNRYHLAVPLNASTANNTLFVFNALNQTWESRDAYSISLDELLTATYNNQRRLFAASRAGTLFLLDEMERGDDLPYANEADIFLPVKGILRTRRYAFGTLNAKRLLRVKASTILPAGADCKFNAVTTDYDAVFTLATLSNSSADGEEDYTLKAPLRCKATYLDLEFTTHAQRPTLRQITAEATRSAFDRTETRTLN